MAGKRATVLTAWLLVGTGLQVLACGGSDGASPARGGAPAQTASGGMAAAGASADGNGGVADGAGRGGSASDAGRTSSAGKANGGAAGSTPLTPAQGTPGVWENVTSSEMDPALFTGNSGFGVGNIVTDPARPTDLYVGGYGSIWKSTDYGLTWHELDSNPNPPYLALGHVLAVAGTTPATLWMANVNGAQHVFKSTDGGLTFTLTGTIAEQPDAASLYSIVVDPNDATHLLSGLHEQDKVLESSDGGDTWHFVSGAGWPAGGKSWFPYFVDAKDPAKTRKTWFAIGQDGGSAVMTTDGGATWTKPTGLEGLQHPHGNAGLFQDATALFVAGTQGPGDGVYRSTDLGSSWTRVTQGSGGVVWGTPKNLYVMWGWACAGCGIDEGGPQFQTAPQPGTAWTKGTVPAELDWGPNSVAVTSDGEHSIMVGSMWATGLWRYVEP
ncbi:MAG: sialidase family protein [Myxococcales bacterium]